MLVKTVHIGETLVLTRGPDRAEITFDDVPYSFFAWREIRTDSGVVVGSFARALGERLYRDNVRCVSVAIDAPDWRVVATGRRLSDAEIKRLADARRPMIRRPRAGAETPATLSSSPQGGA